MGKLMHEYKFWMSKNVNIYHVDVPQ